MIDERDREIWRSVGMADVGNFLSKETKSGSTGAIDDFAAGPEGGFQLPVILIVLLRHAIISFRLLCDDKTVCVVHGLAKEIASNLFLHAKEAL